MSPGSRKIEVRLTLTALITTLLVGGCSQSSYEELEVVRSPDSAFVARTELLEEGGLGSSRYRVIVERADRSQRTVAFEGENGWVSPPVWQNSSTLLVPFCFGVVSSVRSVLGLTGGDTVRYRTSESAQIRLHILTAPYTSVAGQHFCTETEVLNR